DRDATGPHAAGIAVDRVFAIKCLREYAGRRRLASSSRTREEIRVDHAVVLYGPLQGSNGVVLSTEFGETTGSKTTVERSHAVQRSGGGDRVSHEVMLTVGCQV